MAQLPAVTLIRDTETRDATWGTVLVDERKICETLEHLWRNNARNISRIPEGTYPLRWQYSPKRNRNCWWICDVPGRSAIQIHTGNTIRDTDGCVLVGLERWHSGNSSFLLSSVLGRTAFEHAMHKYETAGCNVLVVNRITKTERYA